MILQDLHIHSSFSDGKDSPENIVLSAIKKGITRIGFSDHSYTSFDTSYCIPKQKYNEYRECINSLKIKYSDKIEILCGIEQDFYSCANTKGYDYVIGSVHYLKLGQEYVPVDESADILKDAAVKYFGGDIMCLAECYYKTLGEMAEKAEFDIIGHFDLITKFNEQEKLFDETNKRYIDAATIAVDKLIKTGKPFEINTGAVSRGYKTLAYPSATMMEYISSKGGRFILSSDSHSKETLCFQFEEYSNMVF